MYIERYNYDELNNIFDETDVLLVPSILYETFGFTALEGLSFGVPVIVSDTVGAQDILMDKFGIIVNNITKENLKKVFENLSFEDLKNMNQSIVNLFKVISIEDVSILIKKMCYKRNEV
ncbi:MAG: glycosyltransferase [Holdemanella porci]